MNDSSVSRLRAMHSEATKDRDSEVVEDCGAFGWLRGIRDRAIMLEVRLRNGNIEHFGYAWLHRITFNPSEGIELSFGDRKVTIRGRNLTQEVSPNITLLSCLARQKASWIAESEGALRFTDDGGLIAIDAVEFSK